MSLKFSFWSQRSNLTLEVKGHLNKKLRTLSKKFTEKVLFRYLKRLWSYILLKSIFWPQRSSLTSEVKGPFDIKLWTWSTRLTEKEWKKILDIHHSFPAIEVWNVQFGLRGQIWPRRSKFILVKICEFIHYTSMQSFIVIYQRVFELWVVFPT